MSRLFPCASCDVRNCLATRLMKSLQQVLGALTRRVISFKIILSPSLRAESNLMFQKQKRPSNKSARLGGPLQPQARVIPWFGEFNPLRGVSAVPTRAIPTTSLGRSGRISRGVLNCCDLVPAMDDFAHGMAAFTDRIRDDCVVPMTMSRFIRGVENTSEHAPVSQSNAHGFAEIGFNLLIGHACQIA